MSTKTKVAILFGGRSPEHNISLLSARNIVRSIDRSKYDTILIGIDKQGYWHDHGDAIKILNEDNPNEVILDNINNPVLLSQNTNDRTLYSRELKESISQIDVIFPVLHGTNGEDGSLQGFAKMANIPCVGCGILGSAVGMDKDMTKRVLRDADINVAKSITVRNSADDVDYDEVTKLLGSELFIKPANLGSSVGVGFSDDKESFHKALDTALKYDIKVLIETKVIGREIECAVLGNHEPESSIPGEIIPKSSFYSYDNKYIDEDGAALSIPAKITQSQQVRIQKLAVDTYRVLECRGLARVDMFMTPDDQLIINEINTIPGFTNISMYPKLWEASGLSQQNLISKLIDLAIEEHNTINSLLI